MNRFRECDSGCEDPTVVFECATRRPSDPSSLCCVLTLCDQCVEADVMSPDHVPSVGTYEDMATWVEDHGYRHGISFYE